jgi:hypothetical protein
MCPLKLLEPCSQPIPRRRSVWATHPLTPARSYLVAVPDASVGQSPLDEPGSDDPGDLAIAAVLVGFYSTSGYALSGIVRSVLGRSGVPLSPFVAYILLSAVMVAVFRLEAGLQRRRDWERIKNKWFKNAYVLLVLVWCVPVILGLTMPWSVLDHLSPAASGWLCVVPLALFLGRAF